MRFVEKLRDDDRTTDDYVDLFQVLGTDTIDGPNSSARGTKVFIAEITGQRDVFRIRDAIYDNHLVIADIPKDSKAETSIEYMIDQLREIADETGGDIVKKGESQIIITPKAVEISRKKLNGTRGVKGIVDD